MPLSLVILVHGAQTSHSEPWYAGISSNPLWARVSGHVQYVNGAPILPSSLHPLL